MSLQTTPPSCMKCGDPVTTAVDRRSGPSLLTWNANWNGRCVSCGFQYETRVTTNCDGVESAIEVAPAELQRRRGIDFWDRLPAFRIGLRRRSPEAHFAEHAEKWDDEEKITLTAEELHAICAAIDGPLALLGSREMWHLDTT